MKIMNKSKDNLPQNVKPRGFWGRIAVRVMAKGLRTTYKHVATVLDLKPEDDFLEIGFGSGIFMRSYAAHVRSITGLDHSEDMVKLATKYNQERVDAGTAEFRQGEASQLPWENEKFSAAAAIATFILLPKPLESLKEIHRVLRPGGRLVISVEWNAEDGVDYTKYIKKYRIRLYTGKEIQAMFQEAGFSESSITYSKGFKGHKIIIVRGIK